MINDRFELAVFDPEKETVVSCRDYLSRRSAGDISWIPAVDDSAIILSVNGESWLGDDWNLGDLQLILEQLEDVVARLQREEIAILRSAVVSQPQVPYLLFEPAADATQHVIRISLFFITDAALGMHFPIRYWSNLDPQELFRYVIENRNQLWPNEDDQVTHNRPLKEIPFPRLKLMNDLPEQIALGRKVVELQDRG